MSDSSGWDDPDFLDQLKDPAFFEGAAVEDLSAQSESKAEAEKGKDHRHGHRDRLRQRFIKGGADSLHDYELLELILFMAIPRKDVKPIAKGLIDRFGSYAEVLARPVNSLIGAGLSENAAIALKSIEAAANRMSREEVINKPVISSWQALLKYIKGLMARLDIEQFRVLFLDKKNALITDEVLNEGTVDHTAVYPREIAKRALELSASAVVLIHNHPSGDPTPSRGDIEMTRDIVGALLKLDIKVHDHIVLGRKGHVSFKSQGLL